jgi:hypothetical protein
MSVQTMTSSRSLPTPSERARQAWAEHRAATDESIVDTRDALLIRPIGQVTGIR